MKKTFLIIAVSVVALAFLILHVHAGKQDDKIEAYVKRIHPYSLFEKSLPKVGNRDRIITRENYIKLIAFHTEEYERDFTVDEIKKIAEFCQSDVGKKWMKSWPASKAWNRLLAEVFPEEKKKVDLWTCSMHPQINIAKQGKCPICRMDLIKRKTP